MNAERPICCAAAAAWGLGDASLVKCGAAVGARTSVIESRPTAAAARTVYIGPVKTSLTRVAFAVIVASGYA